VLGPLGTALTAVAASLLGAGLLVPASAATTEEPDTVPPQVRLDPCPEVPLGEACSRREVAAVWQERVDPAEGLAVAGVRVGDTVLSERVYDDGTGFTPYGYWLPPQNDVVSDYDYVTETWLQGPGRYELTFYARDLAGNEATLTRAVQGPDVPDRPHHFRVGQGRRFAQVTWWVDARGSGISHHVVQLKGQEPFEERTSQIAPSYGLQPGGTVVPVRPGRNVVRVRSVNLVGESATGRFVFRVPRR
jgi:hypothetical protein